MKPTKMTYKMLLVSIGVVIVFSLALVFWGWNSIFRMSEQVSILGTEVESMRDESSALSELSIRFQKVSTMVSLVYEAIPTNKGESVFMADVEKLAGNNNLSIESSVIGSSETKSTKSSDYSQTINKTEYYELPIAYEVNGKYSDFTQFIADLGTLRRLNTVDNIVVTSDYSDQNVSGRVVATFNIIIYVKK